MITYLRRHITMFMFCLLDFGSIFFLSFFQFGEVKKITINLFCLMNYTLFFFITSHCPRTFASPKNIFVLLKCFCTPEFCFLFHLLLLCHCCSSPFPLYLPPPASPPSPCLPLPRASPDAARGGTLADGGVVAGLQGVHRCGMPGAGARDRGPAPHRAPASQDGGRRRSVGGLHRRPRFHGLHRHLRLVSHPPLQLSGGPHRRPAQ